MVTIKKAQNGAKADSLMNESNSKKKFANQQEKIGKAAIKSGNVDKTRLIDLKGTTTPTGQGRLDIAKKARKEATKDSIASVKARKMKNGGSLSGLNASTKRDKGIDPKGAFTKVQKKTLAGAKGKASLTKDKQLGATKMKMGGALKKPSETQKGLKALPTPVRNKMGYQRAGGSTNMMMKSGGKMKKGKSC